MIDDDEIIVDEELAEYFEKGDFSDLKPYTKNTQHGVLRKCFEKLGMN